MCVRVSVCACVCVSTYVCVCLRICVHSCVCAVQECECVRSCAYFNAYFNAYAHARAKVGGEKIHLSRPSRFLWQPGVR